MRLLLMFGVFLALTALVWGFGQLMEPEDVPTAGSPAMERIDPQSAENRPVGKHP